MHTLVRDFTDYANSFRRGFLKTWKAESMIHQIESEKKAFSEKAMIYDEVRFLAWIKNCLEMEGFSGTGCELIMGWLYERMA